MGKIYFKLFIGIIISLWIIYFIQYFIFEPNYSVETFTPKINSMYRPYVRTINSNYENFVSNYGPNVIMNKLKKWNIY